MPLRLYMVKLVERDGIRMVIDIDLEILATS